MSDEQLPLDAVRWLDAMEVAIVVVDRSGRIAYANPAAMLLTSAGIVGSHVADWDVVTAEGDPLPPDERPHGRVLKRGEPVRDELIGLRPANGVSSRRWLRVSTAPGLGDDGRPRFSVAALSDVSVERDRLRRIEHENRKLLDELETHRAELSEAEKGRRRAEAELTSHLHLYESVFGVIREGIVVHGGDGTIHTANPAAEAILGLSIDQMNGVAAVDPAWRLIGEDLEPLPPESIPSEITRRTGRPCPPTVLGVHRPSGETAWLRVSAVPLQREAEGFSAVATFENITQGRAAQLALEATRARIQRVTEAAPGVLFQMLQRGKKRRIVFVSARAEDALGVSVAALIEDATLLDDRIHAEDRTALWRAFTRAVSSLGLLEREVRIRGRDDVWRWFRISALPEETDDGVLWSGVMVDATDRRRLEEQLRHTQRREAMGDLAAGVAHNFNNVLAAVLPNLEDCLRIAPPEMREMLEDALRASRGAAELVEQLLLSTRRDDGSSHELVDLAEIVRQVAALSDRSFGRRIHISVELPEGPAFVSARASELHQVLLNLAINARDAMEETAHAQLVLAVRREKGHLVLTVRDSGIGMSDAVRERLGEPFFTTKPPGRGTGLGLATAYSILHDLGATVAVDSTAGRGTTFTISFPLPSESWRPPGPRPSSSTPPSAEAAEAPGRLDGHRILLVDDDVLVRRALARRLRRVGAEVHEAVDGASGLEVVHRSGHHLSCVLLDLSMPGLSGVHVLSSIRTTHPQLPVVVVTGHVPENVNLGGAHAVLIKPVDGKELMSRLGELAPQR